MRIRLSDKDRTFLFKGLSLKQISEVTGVSIRTITDWRRGKYTIPAQHFDKIIKVAAIDPKLLKTNNLDNWWSNSEAGKKGAIIRMQKHGPLGTPEGRRLGGKNSYAQRKNYEGDIFTRNKILLPSRNELLAEFIGIMIGDGSVTKYQVSVSLSSLVDNEYSIFVTELIKKLFGLRPRVTKRKDSSCWVIVVSSVELVEFLMQNGVLQGDKIRQNLDIPRWILEDREYAMACLRGIFDTDGCVFQECHTIKQKKYCYLRWALVSASSYLRTSLYEILIDLEFGPKIRNNRSVNLENFAEIAKYFKMIGTSNPKHLNRFRSFGGVG